MKMGQMWVQIDLDFKDPIALKSAHFWLQGEICIKLLNRYFQDTLFRMMEWADRKPEDTMAPPSTLIYLVFWTSSARFHPNYSAKKKKNNTNFSWKKGTK